MSSIEQSHKSGFVGIIGRPNVGKSTLMNTLLGQKLSIVTAKAQTTRHRIKGILNSDNYQIVFSDTPGMLDPHYLLHQKMMNFVNASLEDADAVLFIHDTSEGYMDESLVQKLKTIKSPVIVIINKVYFSNPEEVNKLIHGWKKAIQPHAIIPVSAKEEYNLQAIIDTLLEILPASPAYFNKENLSDATERFFITEIIREKIFLNYDKEIPYAAEVGIEEFKEQKDITRIRCSIYVERDSQKGIIIGNGGEGIKKLGTQARKDIEHLLGKKVFLDLQVKVEKDWRKREQILHRFGYK